jgi:hypothetical protein
MKNSRLLRIIVYFLLLPILSILAVVLYAVCLEAFSYHTWQFNLLAWGSLLFFIVSLVAVFFTIFKLMKQLGLKICILIFLIVFFLDVYANFRRVSIYQKLPFSLVTSTQMATNDTWNNGKAFLQWGPAIYKNIYLTATGQEYLKYIKDSENSTPISNKNSGFDTISYCKNITFTKPYTVGQKGVVKVDKEFDPDQTYSSIVLYKDPAHSSNHTDQYQIGDELILKEGPIPSNYDDVFYWKVGYENDNSKDGWCVDDFGPSPQG